MLVLSRNHKESVLIGDDVRVTVIRTPRGGVRLAIEAPDHVHILRQELSPRAWVPPSKRRRRDAP